MTEQRRLAAILVADVVGYSKLIGSDEAGTLAQLGALRAEIIEPQIAKHAGRLFKSMGDGFFIEFASAVQAVSCAKAIQEANGPGRLPLRIGIHVGDVVVQGDDLLGDGVNVAARIEGIADPGGIAIARAVHEQVRDKLDLGFKDKGHKRWRTVMGSFKQPEILRELKAASDGLKSYDEAERKAGNRISTLRMTLSHRKTLNLDPISIDDMIAEVQDGLWRMMFEVSQVVTHLKTALELVPNEMPSTSGPTTGKPGVR